MALDWTPTGVGDPERDRALGDSGLGVHNTPCRTRSLSLGISRACLACQKI